MEEKKPWWKKILEKIGILKEEKPMLEGQILNEPLKRDVDFSENKKDDFNESLKVEVKPKEPTKEEIVFEVLKEKGIDSKLLENPRFKEDILKQVETIGKIEYPEEELTVEQAKNIANIELMVNKNGGLSYKKQDRNNGQIVTNTVNYEIENNYYAKYDSYTFVPMNDGGEAVKTITKNVYNNNGIEEERKVINSKHEEYDYNNGTTYGSGRQDILTMSRQGQGIDKMYCTIERYGISPYGSSNSLGFTVGIDNRYPEDLYIPQVLIQGLYSAKNFEELKQARDGINQSELFYNEDRKAEYEQFKASFAKGIEKSKYSKELIEFAKHEQPEYAKLLEQDKDM